MAKYQDQNYKKLINCYTWQQIRAKKLHECPLCERCTSKGRVTAAEEVHHVIPIESGFGPEEMARLAYSPDNLMAVCRRCHRELHFEMGKGRKAEAKRRAEARLAAFKTKFNIR